MDLTSSTSLLFLQEPIFIPLLYIVDTLTLVTGPAHHMMLVESGFYYGTTDELCINMQSINVHSATNEGSLEVQGLAGSWEQHVSRRSEVCHYG